MGISNRKLMILKAIVDDYIMTALPSDPELWRSGRICISVRRQFAMRWLIWKKRVIWNSRTHRPAASLRTKHTGVCRHLDEGLNA